MKRHFLLIPMIVVMLGALALTTTGSEGEQPIPDRQVGLKLLPANSSDDALGRFNGSKPLKEVLGETFIDAVTIVKDRELLAYQQVISSWEREHLLLKV